MTDVDLTKLQQGQNLPDLKLYIVDFGLAYDKNSNDNIYDSVGTKRY